jgi:outer membrane protein assembly factor BamB
VGFAGALVACGTEPEQVDWPQFRGPNGVGLIAATGLPEQWGPDSPNVRWRAEVPGSGNSSPIVAGGRVFLTTAIEKGDSSVERSVVAIDGNSGELLWQTPVVEEPLEHRHRLNTFAAPTPATDGLRIYAFFGRTLGAVDLDGELLWSREVDPNYHELSHYGASSSAVLAGDVVVVARDREDAVHGSGWLGAFDRATGEEVWRRTWVDTCCSYATPMVLKRSAGEEILFTHAARVTSYHPATGETLWSQELRQNQPVTTPTIAGDMLAVFTGADHVRNGAMLRLTGGGADTSVEVLWQTHRMIPQVASPVLYEGLLYTVADNGVMLCYEPETGKVKWQKRLEGAGFRPSLVAGDGKIYVVDSYAHTSVVAAGPKFRLIAENDLGEPGNASPAFGNGCLLLRTATALFCIDDET